MFSLETVEILKLTRVQLFNEANVLQALHLIFGVLDQSDEPTLKIHACDLLQQVLSTYAVSMLFQTHSII
jgi:hypothetical protein